MSKFTDNESDYSIEMKQELKNQIDEIFKEIEDEKYQWWIKETNSVGEEKLKCIGKSSKSTTAKAEAQKYLEDKNMIGQSCYQVSLERSTTYKNIFGKGAIILEGGECKINNDPIIKNKIVFGDQVKAHSILHLHYLPSEIKKFKKNHYKGLVKVMYDKKFPYKIDKIYHYSDMNGFK